MVELASGDISFLPLFICRIPSTKLRWPRARLSCAALGISARLEGVANLRFKESDRIESIAKGLKHLGREVFVEEDVMLIPVGEPVTKESLAAVGEIDSCDDHRIAMAFGALKVLNPELKISNPDVVSKSFPDFWKMLDRLIVL